MKFSELEERLRRYETGHDIVLPLGTYVVARLDGRGFTKLLRNNASLEKPFDQRVSRAMSATTERLMLCGFDVVYGYTQSDEISLLFHRHDAAFGRKSRKWLSILAGEASATFSARFGDHCVFDCRLSLLPARELVVDYFRWRQEDARRNAVQAYCYWRLRDRGESARAATSRLQGKNVTELLEFLPTLGVDFDTVPAWQRFGIGHVWESVARVGENPKTGEKTTTTRRAIRVIEELPVHAEYGAFLESLPFDADPEGSDLAASAASALEGLGRAVTYSAGLPEEIAAAMIADTIAEEVACGHRTAEITEREAIANRAYAAFLARFVMHPRADYPCTWSGVEAEIMELQKSEMDDAGRQAAWNTFRHIYSVHRPVVTKVMAKWLAHRRKIEGAE